MLKNQAKPKMIRTVTKQKKQTNEAATAAKKDKKERKKEKRQTRKQAVQQQISLGKLEIVL